MPKPALSLVGYLEKEKALEYLQKTCLSDDPSPQALLQHYTNAQSQLGPAIQKAGYPEILDIPAGYESYINMVKTTPYVKAFETGNLVTIQLVEIAPLLAFQVHIELERAESLYQPTNEVPGIVDMLAACLPLVPQSIPFEFSHPQSPNTVMMRTPSLNLRAFNSGLFTLPNGENYFGVKIDGANPFVQVVRFEGRAYLINGFHRAYSLGKAGAKYFPCIFQEVHSLSGIVNLGFPLELLQSDNPPSLSHYIYERAYPVKLRNYRKHMVITYAEHLYFEE